MTKKFRFLGALGTVAVVVLLVASCTGSKAAKQDFSASSWTLTTPVATSNAMFGSSAYSVRGSGGCGSDSTSLNPIAVVNTYTTPQQISITINTVLSNNLNFIPAAPSGGNPTFPASCAISPSHVDTQTVTVPAGAPDTPSFTVVGWIAAGGQAIAPGVTASHNLAIGAGGQQWYDYWLHQSTTGSDFKNLELNYSNTGGTDPSRNLQTGLFNGLDCSSNQNKNIFLTFPNTLTTPFTSDNANAWTFNLNQPICFGFLQPNSASQG